MNDTILKQFRHAISRCFLQERDALFNAVDALSTETQAHSFPELSQSPYFERRWCSLYKGLKRGRINRKELRKVLVEYLPIPCPERRLVLGIDASDISRPKSVTAADRTAMPMHNLPSVANGSTPITFGWQYSTVVALPESASSWTYVLDQERITSKKTAIQVAVEQLKELVPLLSVRPLVLFDRGYDSNWLWCQCSGLNMDLLGRVKRNRNFYRPNPARTGKSGTPRKDGNRLQPKDPSTHGEPDEIWSGTNTKGHMVTIRCWQQMHVKEARWLDLTIFQVIRTQARGSKRDPHESWFVYQGQCPEQGVAQLALFYELRFGQEHGYRFEKQALLWEEPRLRTPEQFERWTQIVALGHNQLVLARNLVVPELRPWERKQCVPTPQHVRRSYSEILATVVAKFLPQLGTPACPPRPRGKPKGRSKGATVYKAPRFEIVCKTTNLPQIVPL